MKKQPGPPGKGQRSIASFLFSKAKRQKNELRETCSETNVVDFGDVIDINLAGKTHRLEKEPLCKPPQPVPVQPPAPGVDGAARHARWQAKLLGDESSAGIMKRISTQEGVIASQDKQKLSPLELQVTDLQHRHPDCVLAIEVGYKFRFFGRDAEVASEVLGIFSYPDRNFLTAGVPTARIDVHIRRLVAAGHKVGVVRQAETAALKAAGQNRYQPFERKLTEMYTKATLEAGALGALVRSVPSADHDPDGGVGECEGDGATLPQAGRLEDAGYVNEHRSSFVVCILEEPDQHRAGCVHAAIVAVETSTGQVLYSQVTDTLMRAELESRLMFAAPSDLLMVEPLSDQTRRLLESYASNSTSGVRRESIRSPSSWDSAAALTALKQVLHPPTLADTLAMNLPRLVLCALSHVLEYLKPFNLEGVLRFGDSSFQDFSELQELALGPNTLQQLEVLRNTDDGQERGSLLWLMDRTLSAAGARLMRRWVSRPLRNVDEINKRLDAVQEMLSCVVSHPVLSKLPTVLSALPLDIERSLGRILHGTSTPSEMLLVLKTFNVLHSQLGMVADLNSSIRDATTATASSDATPTPKYPPPLASPGVKAVLLQTLLRAAGDLGCAAVARHTLASINEEAASANDKLGLFADDERFADVASKREDCAAAEADLEALRPDLALAINVDKVEYVSIQNQGEYLVEVPVDLEKRAPKTWVKVSSTKKVVRFRPPQVKTALSNLELAREHLAKAAHTAWRQLQTDVSEHYLVFRKAVQALAALDCLNSFASLASAGGYCRPVFCNEDETQMRVEAGRHPVLDAIMSGTFVPNDTHLAASRERCAIITGPNMGGKSCFIRQNALLAIMAQAGSFVPAASCRLSVFDAIFTRMGAADNIALGRSTFLEELR